MVLFLLVRETHTQRDKTAPQFSSIPGRRVLMYVRQKGQPGSTQKVVLFFHQMYTESSFTNSVVGIGDGFFLEEGDL